MTTPYSCPECGGSLYIDEHAETEVQIVCKGMAIRGRALPTMRVRVVVAFCSACEFTLEIRPDVTTDKR